MTLRSALLAFAATALAAAIAPAASADGIGQNQTTRHSQRLYHYQPANPGAGDTSLGDLFRDGRYDTSTYLFRHPLPDGSLSGIYEGRPYPYPADRPD